MIQCLNRRRTGPQHTGGSVRADASINKFSIKVNLVRKGYLAIFDVSLKSARQRQQPTVVLLVLSSIGLYCLLSWNLFGSTSGHDLNDVLFIHAPTYTIHHFRHCFRPSHTISVTSCQDFDVVKSNQCVYYQVD